MEILVGKGGNQSMPITDETVSRIHCKIEVLDSGFIAVTNLSASGTFLNGQKLVKRTLVKREDELQLGVRFKATIHELLDSVNYETFTWHQVVRDKYLTSNALQAFISTSAQKVNDQLPCYFMPVVKSAMAYYMTDEEKFREAQSLIYEAGDMLYDMQDGSELLQGIYASVLTVCARLYLHVDRLDVAKETILGAAGIFDRLQTDCLGCSMEQRKETYNMAAEILTKSGQTDQAAVYSNKV